MTRRDRYELEQARADLLAALTEADGPLRTDTLICRAHGMHDPSLVDTSWWRFYTTSYADLRALERERRVIRTERSGHQYATWQLATADLVDAQDDAAEVDRMMAGWQDAAQSVDSVGGFTGSPGPSPLVSGALVSPGSSVGSPGSSGSRGLVSGSGSGVGPASVMPTGIREPGDQP